MEVGVGGQINVGPRRNALTAKQTRALVMIWHNRNWRGRRRKQSSTTTTSERKTRMKEKERERERGRKRWRMKGARMTRVMKSQTKEERDDVWVFLLFLVASRFHLLYRMIRREIRLDIFFSRKMVQVDQKETRRATWRSPLASFLLPRLAEINKKNKSR